MENSANVIPFPGTSRAPLKIACLSYHLPENRPWGDSIDRVAHDLAHGLAQRGHDVTVWSFDPKPDGAAYQVQPLPGKRAAHHWLGKFLVRGHLGPWLGLHPGFRDADIILAHADSLFLPVWKKPVVRILHGSALMEATAAENALQSANLLFIHAQDVLTALTQKTSVASSQTARRHNSRIANLIPNGIDLSRFKPGGRKNPKPSILFVADSRKAAGGGKRGNRLIEWFWSNIRPRHPAASLWMVCEPGPSLPGVTYFPRISRTGLLRLYQRAWVFASPARYEASGVSCLQAMACETPVLATLNARSRELLGDGRYGSLSTDADFPNVLAGLLGDAHARRKLAVSGGERAREFTLELCLDRYEALLYSVCPK